jgi:hypothetical protein
MAATFPLAFSAVAAILFPVQGRYPFRCFRRDPSCCFLTENDILIEEVQVSGTSLAIASYLGRPFDRAT